MCYSVYKLGTQEIQAMNFEFKTTTIEDKMEELIDFVYGVSNTMMHEDAGYDAERDAVAEILEKIGGDEMMQRSADAGYDMDLDDFCSLGDVADLIQSDAEAQLVVDVAIASWQKYL